MEPFWVIDSACPQDPLPSPGRPGLTHGNLSGVCSVDAERLANSGLVMLL